MDGGIARMGEVVFTSPDQIELKALGLGSCIGLCMFDPHIKVGCLAHIVLPQAKSADTAEVVKYADTAVPYVIKEMLSRGALQYRMRVVIAGGAQLFTFADGSESKLDVGRRNADTVKQMLSQSRLKLMAEDIGGNQGRTMTLSATTGLVTVKQNGHDLKTLANLLS